MDSSDFVKDLGTLIPSAFAAQVGLKYSSSQAVYLNTGSSSGYASMYQNTVPDNKTTGWNGDQGHHFAAFVEFGYQWGSTAGTMTSALYELFQAAFGSIQGETLNMGDIQLGITAAQMGADLKAGKIGADDVSSQIRNSLCSH